MTDEMRHARDEQLIAAFTVVLAAGHTIEDAEGLLRIEPRGNGHFAVKVCSQEFGLPTERDDLFPDVRAAVAYYLDLCEPIGT